MLRWARAAVMQPISRSVAADDAHFLASKGAPRLVLRLLRRRLELALSGQARSECTRRDPRWKRALWLHVEAPQIGDALMDLAPRSLLAEQGVSVDLLAAPAVTALFSGDAGFRRLLSAETDIDPAAYDFAIVDSRAWKALAAKRRRAPALPWFSIRADYLGYDFQRGLLATRRLAEFLGVALDDAAERRHARQKLMLDDAASRFAPAVPGPPKRGALQVAIALGGVRPERTYLRWAEVAQRLASVIDCRFTLLGSSNARAAATAFAATGAAAGWQVDDQVERSDLPGARRAMQSAGLVLCADGGLMHLALTTDTPLVAVFDASVDPAWRLPDGFGGSEGVCLRASGRDVNLIPAQQVAAAALQLVGQRQR